MPNSRIFSHPHPFQMVRGGQLPSFELAWESWGRLNAAGDNAVLILTGLSPSAHAAANEQDPEPGWWEFMLGPGKPIDTDHWYVVCANSLGSCMGSTGPASIDPRTGQVYAVDFPDLSLEDIAASARLLLAELGIERLAAVIGPSMGGMSAQALCGQYPGIARHMLSISSAPNPAPWAIAIRSLQRECIRSDPDYRSGRYHGGPGPVTGMRLARKLGMLSYRSAREWDARFGRERVDAAVRSDAPFAPEFQIESYLEAHAERFIGGFDPNCYLYLSRAMDWFDVLRYGRSMPEAVGSFGLESALVMGVETDILFPPQQQKELASGLSASGVRVDFHLLSSVQGHDAFLVDEPRFAPPVADFLAAIAADKGL